MNKEIKKRQKIKQNDTIRKIDKNIKTNKGPENKYESKK